MFYYIFFVEHKSSEGYMLTYFSEGGVLMHLLLFCSFMCVSWGIYHILYITILFKHSTFQLLKRCATELHNNNVVSSDEILQCIYFFIHQNDNNLSIESFVSKSEFFISMSYDHLIKKLQKHFAWIQLIIRTAPIIGILGTVIGIILAFEGLSVINSLDGFDIIIAGISQALYTTAYGLSVAILSIIFFNIYKSLMYKYLDLFLIYLNVLSIELNQRLLLKNENQT